MSVGGQAYTPPTMSARTTSAPRTRRIRTERRRADRVESMSRFSLSAGAGVARTSVEAAI